MRGEPVAVVSGGRQRVFLNFDWGTDTFIFEKNVWKEKPGHAPVLIVRKSALVKGRNGRIMTITSGTHVTAAIPLLRGDFSLLGKIPERDRSNVMTKCILCANIVSDGAVMEISQRDIPTEEMHASDLWLRGLGWSLNNIVMAERSDGALDYYRRLGQEWRIKPLVWTRTEMDAAIAASRTRLHSDFTYYHSVKGVHFLSFEEFSALIPLCSVDFDSVKVCLNELVHCGEVGDVPAMLDPKFAGHHEIELFGIRDLAASMRIVQMLVALQQSLDAVTPEECEDALAEIVNIYRSALSYPDLAETGSELFVSSMYKHLTGEIYNTQDQIVPAFDDRKTALPGATYRGGKPDYHPGIDARSHAIIEYTETLLSSTEFIEYINIYELRDSTDLEAGKYPTREIEYKTNFMPTTKKLIEKRLAQKGQEYSSYLIARVQAFQSLGIAYGDHHILQRSGLGEDSTNYYIRDRYQGYAINSISQNRFKRPVGTNGEFVDFPEAILKISVLAGHAAAQTMILKKYTSDRHAEPVWFGHGKEIVEFKHDVAWGCDMPSTIRLCSVRGTLGWPCVDKTKENIDHCFATYVEAFAKASVDYQKISVPKLPLDAVMNDFCAGFIAATREIYWNYYNKRELFENFNPALSKKFRFRQKWLFALWALEQQYNNVERLAAMIKVATARIAAKEDGLDI